MNPDVTIISVLVLYLIILLVIGFWGRGESTSVAGYYVAGKKLPGWVIAFSSNATGESAWLLLGLTGVGYLVGIHALWIVLGEILDSHHHLRSCPLLNHPPGDRFLGTW